MFLRILKKDLARKKTMNIIIVIFVILASMFVASGLNNVITVIKIKNNSLASCSMDKTIKIWEQK